MTTMDWRKEPARRSIKVDAWPESDRRAWDVVNRPGDVFESGGASHWAASTRETTARCYGRWLGWLARNGLLDAAQSPGDRLSPDRLERYIAELASLNAYSSATSQLGHLYMAISVMAPKHDWRWMRSAEARLRQMAAPKNKRGRLVEPDQLYAYGLELMASADAAEDSPVFMRALSYRNGLMISLLAARPFRRRNFVSIEIGRHLTLEAGSYTPKLISRLREGYSLADLHADFVSGLTVAVVAIPLSMAIAIASGVTPDRGLYTSIVGGFLVSALGGSRFQIGGPAGAFVVLVSATVQEHGMDGLLLATLLSGIFLILIGAFRLGSFIKYIPYPVTVAFTAGIAIVIFSGEISDLFGLHLHGPEPGPLIPKLKALAAAANTITPTAVAIASAAIIAIVAVRKARPLWPAYLIGVAIAALTVLAFHLPVETIGTKFGGIPRGLPMPHVPPLSIAKVREVLPAAFSFALLGSIESLLSAVVADSMTGRRHRSNAELVAQGIANIGSSLFGGICVTGTIARTATNVRAGSRSPVSGIIHAAALLLLMMIAAPLASYIPLAALAAVLAVVCWSMAEKHEFWILLRASRADAIVVLATFLLVIFKDLTTGIVVGFCLASLVFLYRMAQMVQVDRPLIEDDLPDNMGTSYPRYDSSTSTDPNVVVYRISGAFFFGAAAGVAAALERTGEHPRAYVIDFSAVSILDSTAAATIAGIVHRAHRHGVKFFMAGAGDGIRGTLLAHGVSAPAVAYYPALTDALADARKAAPQA